MSEFWSHYREILSDPAHLAVEITLMLLIDVLFLGVAWPFMVNRIHRRIDKSHGHEHGGKAANVRLPDGKIMVMDPKVLDQFPRYTDHESGIRQIHIPPPNLDHVDRIVLWNETEPEQSPYGRRDEQEKREESKVREDGCWVSPDSSQPHDS